MGSGIFYISKALLPRIPDFYEEEHWDAVFFGTSQSYCTFDPEIFDEYGLKTYNRGRQQQTMNYTYYYVKDALDNSDIDVVVLEILECFMMRMILGLRAMGVRDSSLNDLTIFRYKSGSNKRLCAGRFAVGLFVSFSQVSFPMGGIGLFVF